MSDFRSGFINIIGHPNVGKSTLINQMVGEKISIVSPKVQTTRQRILGFVSGQNYQMIISDTPGLLDAGYELHKVMKAEIEEAFEDADVILYLTEAEEPISKHLSYVEKIKTLNVPIFLVINKIDLTDQTKLESLIEEWSKLIDKSFIVPMSALHGFNTQSLRDQMVALLPIHEAYFPDDILTDKSERFIASEMIREQIFNIFYQEIPYSVEVMVNSFKDEEKIIRISAEIFVNRKSQKPILIGKNGSAMKALGSAARLEMEKFFGKKIFLELHVKVKENWRDDKSMLRYMGYRI